MKLTEAMIAVMTAYKEGKKIEYLNLNRPDDKWTENPTPKWCWGSFDYRVKPEPRYRPYANAEECFADVQKHGGWVKEKDTGYYLCIGRISNYGVKYTDSISENFEALFNENVWGDDGSACGVLEE